MSRLFIFLLGLLVGAFAVHLAYDRGWIGKVDDGRLDPVTAANAPDVRASIPAEPRPAIATSPSTDTATAPVASAPVPTLQPQAPGGEPPLAFGREPLSPLSSEDLMLPVAGVKRSQLVDTYTQSRGEGRLHDAIDIMAPRGTPVVAVAEGRVAKLFHSQRGGLTVYQFDSGDNVAYYYAHLDSYAEGLTEGKLLKRGDLVGYVGSTGNANPDGPHLHFAIFLLGPEKNWWQGTAINPYPLLGGRPATGG